MTRTRGLALGAAGLVVAMFGLNLFGKALNEFFLALPGIDKVLHLAFYAVLFVGLHALAGKFFQPRIRTLVVLVAGLLLAVSDEAVQGFSPERSVEAGDLLADCCGLTAGWVLSAKPPRLVAAIALGAALTMGLYLAYDTHVLLIDYSRGLRSERQQDFARAREHYLRALQTGLRTADLYNGLAWAQTESGQGDPRDAVRWARLALDMQPGDADILDTYGWALHHAGRSAEALAPLQDAYAKNPRIFCIHYHLGAVYLALGRGSEAEEHFRQQLALTGTREARFAQQALDRMDGRQ